MSVILTDKCIGCKICQKYCTVDAIHYNPETKQCEIDQATCVECYVCLRQKVCPRDAIAPPQLDTFLKQFQHVMSDPIETHSLTGVAGRGTEEVKTNDVTGRIKRNQVGICIDMGRPGMGVYLRDTEKVAMALAAAHCKLAPKEHTPLANLMTDLKTGKLQDNCLDCHLLSVIIEGVVDGEYFPGVMMALKEVAHDIDTVFSLGLIIRTEDDGSTHMLDCLDDLQIDRPYRGKVNVGLGRPLSDD